MNLLIGTSFSKFNLSLDDNKERKINTAAVLTNPRFHTERNLDIFIPSFTGSKNRSDNATKRGRFLKKLNNITDPYSGNKILSLEEYIKYKNTIPKIENTNIRIIKMYHYIDNMRPVEKSVFLDCSNKIRKYEKDKTTSGYLTFSQILKDEEPQAIQRLIHKEYAIINKILEETNSMDQNTAQEVINAVNSVIPAIESKGDKHFERNEFISTLIDLREKQKDNPQVQNIIKLAHKLPNSHIDKDAFIVKYANCSEEKITRQFVKSSVGTIEHIIPYSQNGYNEAPNFLLTSEGSNTERGSILHQDFINLHPKIPRYCQEYINDIIAAGNRGELSGHEWYPYTVADSMKQEMGITLNLSKYKIKPKKAFRTFPERLLEMYPQYSVYIKQKESLSEKISNRAFNPIFPIKINNTPIIPNITTEAANDTFVRVSTNNNSTSNGKFLKKLKKVHDPYSGILILQQDDMKRIANDLESKTNIRQKIKYLDNYTESMLPVEHKIFQLFKAEHKRETATNFTEILKHHQQEAFANLINEQNKIFKQINEGAKNISPESREKVLQETTEAKWRVQLPIEDRHRFKRKYFINKIVLIQQNIIMDKIAANITTLSPEKQSIANKEFTEVSNILQQFTYDTNLKGKTPVDMVKALQKKYAPETLNDKDEIAPLIDIAKQLPTSKNSTNAFIIKYCDRTEKEIGERLLNQSIGSIEHIVAASLGGQNEASNFMLTTAGRNSERGNMPIQEFIKMHPDIPKHCQTYIDDIIKNGNKGKLKGYEWYPYLFRDTWKKESGIEVDISKYKIPPERAFLTLPPRLRYEYPKYLKYIPEPTEPLHKPDK